ncbi:Rab acceptor 1 (prenylated), isoform CRA_d [Rattus norvegicus]|uniref:Rab acceptor 1 (Prenylated), isoform CRA_d n=1 Tax=Rattus norvegicus TaxID=10116 RepID=A6J928_RAT|nr:Rab acceptor 1 (prenylated), isoform CRA_d [Rattus norvegicus]
MVRNCRWNLCKVSSRTCQPLLPASPAGWLSPLCLFLPYLT